MAQTVELLKYGSTPKARSTFGNNGNLAEITMAKTETGSNVILEAVLAP